MSDEIPVTPEEALLQAYLERPLSNAEKQKLLAAARNNPVLADDAALMGLLRELRLERRISKNEGAAWQAFSHLAAQQLTTSRATGAPSRWQDWLATLWNHLQPAIPALAAAVIVVQTGGLVWLTSHREITYPDAIRGGAVNTCPAVLARFKPIAAMTDVSRVLTQTQASIVAGPDAAGLYRLQGPGTFAQDASTLLQGLASETKPAPDCDATSQ